jgi:N6-L-threonylcarbamoyladenine synthase
LSKLAQNFIDKNPDVKLTFFPRPMISENNFDWSFSGLKTAVLREIKNKNNSNKEKLAAEIQEAIVDSLVKKSLQAIEIYKPKSFLLGGGVASNSRLQKKFQNRIAQLRDSGKLKEISFHVPESSLCTDNAAAIGAAAFFVGKKTNWQKINADPELTITD